jgi:hypothetical protein
MVVNNWPVIFKAYTDVTTRSHLLYFITWWIFCHVIMLNVFLSQTVYVFQARLSNRKMLNEQMKKQERIQVQKSSLLLMILNPKKTFEKLKLRKKEQKL